MRISNAVALVACLVSTDIGALGCSASGSGTGCTADSGACPNNDGAVDSLGDAQPCNGAHASLLAFASGATALAQRAATTAKQWTDLCNKINSELGLDASQTAADGACAVTAARIKQAVGAGVSVALAVEGFCPFDQAAAGKCDATCHAAVGCDVRSKCEPGKLVTACDGLCSGSCAVGGPAVVCDGSCEGACSSTVSASCSGQCAGTCGSSSWTGSCDAGCVASFDGTCDGSCKGTCDGTAISGACSGRCRGTCIGKATGNCEAKCTGTFEGHCSANCSGKCTIDGVVSCRGACSGTCTSDPSAGKCSGACYGSCAVEIGPPTCAGRLACDVDSSCIAWCHTEAAASGSCVGKGTWIIAGDAVLSNVLTAHASEFGAVFEATNRLGATTALPLVVESESTKECAAAARADYERAIIDVRVSVQAATSITGFAH